MQRNIYIFMGPPGAGKGTLSLQCVQNFGWKQLSTGALCREHIALQTEIGKQIDFIIKSGKLISDSLIIAMVEHWLTNQGVDQALIFDGFPRTVYQAQAFDEILKKPQFADYALRVVLLDVPEQTLISRLIDRAVCSNPSCQAIYTISAQEDLVGRFCAGCLHSLVRRPDDKESVVKERLFVYKNHAQGLIDFFNDRGYRIITIPATEAADEVYKKLKYEVGVSRDIL